MTVFSGTDVVIARTTFALVLCAAISCQTPPPPKYFPGMKPAVGDQPGQAGGIGIEGVPIRDLSQDEAAGGHILRKHVGQSDEQLRQRLERERRITGASTYTDRTTAEQAVGAAIATSHDRIQRWLNRPGGHPNLVLDYDSPAPIGRTINRGESQSHACAHALVVLKYVGPNDYYVLTSYPECRS